MLRPEPRPPGPSSSRAITTAGRRHFSTRREATIPTTPGCQPAPATTSAAWLAWGAHAASAANRMRVSASWRSRLRKSSSRAISSARSPDSVSSSSSAASARPMRPAALMRGPSRKPSDCSDSSPGSTAAIAISERSPGLSVRARARSPSRTIRLFSPRSGTRSHTVASAARSRSSSAVAGSWPADSRSACDSFSTTPAAHSAAGYGVASGGAGCTSGQSGSSGPGRW